MYLYHYYEKSLAPFLNISELTSDEAEAVLNAVRQSRPNSQCAQRPPEYVRYRRSCEEILRTEFRKKGGRTERSIPHYMTLGHSPWLSTWFDDCACIKIPAEEFDMSTVSFTYGDSMPTFSPKITDGREYRKKLYTYDEILGIIAKYGMPQDWNDDGSHGPERYIEAHVWSDSTVGRYRHGG